MSVIVSNIQHFIRGERLKKLYELSLLVSQFFTINCLLTIVVTMSMHSHFYYTQSNAYAEKTLFQYFIEILKRLL